MKKFKNTNGITLIALVITIVVLLILAGVSISMLTGDNGILTKASEAKEKTQKAQAEEEVRLAVLASIGTNGKINPGDLKDNLNKIKGIETITEDIEIEEGDYTVKVNGYKFTIKKDGDVQFAGGSYEEGGSSQTPASKPLTGITIAEESIIISIGQTKQINVTKEPADTTENIEYSSDTESVATVSDSGLITAIAEGTATITVQGAKTTTIKEEIIVTVTKPGEPNATTGLFTKNSTINGLEVGTANNPTIPAGYRPIDVTTGQTLSSWGDGTVAPAEASVKNGLVITDAPEGSSDGNEFVWIPVATISEMAREIDGASLDANGNKQYRGVLYNFGTTLSANTEKGWSADSTSYREPANLSYSTQEEYNKMVKQVEKYKGFYVGRYETSVVNNVAQSKSGKTSTNNVSWYNLYKTQIAYAQETDSTKSVVSSMIWGSQYDAMMRWMQSNGVDVTSTTASKVQNATSNTGSTTGGTSKDIINNVYDLLGNRFEWTQEAYSNSYLVLRGGDCYNAVSPSNRRFGDYSRPANTDSNNGSRLTLYIKN